MENLVETSSCAIISIATVPTLNYNISAPFADNFSIWQQLENVGKQNDIWKCLRSVCVTEKFFFLEDIVFVAFFFFFCYYLL